jgi:hypothetical protein
LSRQGKQIAGFGKVASDDANKNNNNINVNINENNIIDKLSGKSSKKDMKGIYFDLEVAAALDDLGKQGGRGAISKVVNEATKKYLQEHGLL